MHDLLQYHDMMLICSQFRDREVLLVTLAAIYRIYSYILSARANANNFSPNFDIKIWMEAYT